MTETIGRNYGGLRHVLRRLIRKTLFVAPVRNEAWIHSLYQKYGVASKKGSVSVDLGCGTRPRNPFQCEQGLGVDIRPSEKVIHCNLAGGRLPFDTASLEAITAYDVLEHIPRVASGTPDYEGNSIQFPFIGLMNEIHRCLKPEGVFFAAFPCYPWPMAFQDPTHVNIMTEDTIRLYFCGDQPWAKIYGFEGKFRLLDEGWVGSHFHVLLSRG
jgi:SAM-dependent methyltransferase